MRITTGTVVTWVEHPSPRKITRRILDAATYTHLMVNKCMSERAPMAAAMLGHEPGDRIKVETAAGTKHVEIVEVTR